MQTYQITDNMPKYVVMDPSKSRWGGFPEKAKVQLRYCTSVTLDAHASTAAYVFALTGMYDPEITGTGHQPSNFDVWGAVYRRHCVTMADVIITHMETSTSNVGPALAGFIVDTSGNQVSSGTDPMHLVEQPYAQFFRVAVGNEAGGLGSGSLKARIPTAKWFGLTDQQMLADDRLCGTVVANPTSPLFLELWAAPVGGDTPSTSITFLVEFVFHATFVDPALTDHS